MRVRVVVALLSALALWLIGVVPANASSEGHPYLALGDSVSFGFDHHLDPTNANNFTGYPEIVAQRLNIEDVNAACSGEATGGFISLTGLDNVCRAYRASFPLHVSYTGSQLAFAVNYLKNNPRTRLVTLMLDANDFFRLTDPTRPAPTPADTSGCLAPNVFAYFSVTPAGCALQNLNAILSGLRATGYTGLIVVVTYYSLDYRDTSGAQFLNAPMIAAATANGAVIASGLEAWRATAMAAGGSSCAAGLLLPAIPPLTGCDIHPSPTGRDLLAGAVIDAISNTCPAHDALGCLNRNQD